MELLITVLGLLAAIYAIVSRERQLDLRLRIGIFARLIVFLGLLVVLCLEFYEFLHARISWVPAETSWPPGITPKNATYLVILLGL